MRKGFERVGDAAFIVFHPFRAITTKIRQIEVGADHAAPPHTATIEGFSTMSVRKADAAIQAAKPIRRHGGVQLADWSASDQKLLRKGKPPKGAPLHQDI